MIKGFFEKKAGSIIFYPACDYPHTKKYLTKVRGSRLWVEEEGSGSPIILLHGGPGGGHCYFHPATSRLAARHRVIYYDMRGVYMSDPPKNECQGVTEDARDLEALRQFLGLKKFTLLGHSYGGIVALEYALKYGANLFKLILCSTPVFWTDRDRSALYAASPRHKAFEKTWKSCAVKQEQDRLYYKWNYSNPLPRQAKKYNELSRLAYTTQKAAKLMSAYEKDKYVPRWEKLGRINIPTLLMFGKRDPDIRPDKAIKRLSLYAHIKTAIFAGCGHDLFTEKPNKFTAVVNNFTYDSPQKQSGKAPWQNIKIRRVNDDEKYLSNRIKDLTGKNPTDLLVPTSKVQHAYFGAFRDGKMIGFSVVLKTDRWILDALYVHPDNRGCGIAGKLTRARIDFARQNGAEKIWYCCDDRNTISVCSHKGYKFTKVRQASPEEAPEPSHWYKLKIPQGTLRYRASVLKYASTPSIAGRGGHIAVVGKRFRRIV
ncbi:MAG: alpha/beta fold hydrolase [Elusimicrobiota bacterium]